MYKIDIPGCMGGNSKKVENRFSSKYPLAVISEKGEIPMLFFLPTSFVSETEIHSYQGWRLGLGLGHGTYVHHINMESF